MRYTKKQFAFLLVNGFKKKIFSKNTDFEIYYEKKHLIIGLQYYLSISEELFQKYYPNIKELLKFSSYHFNVTIEHHNLEANILDSDIFANELRNQLKSDVEVCQNNMLETIHLYANFLRNNLYLLNNL